MCISIFGRNTAFFDVQRDISCAILTSDLCSSNGARIFTGARLRAAHFFIWQFFVLDLKFCRICVKIKLRHNFIFFCIFKLAFILGKGAARVSYA